VIINIMADMVAGGGRVDFAKKGEYSMAEAKAAYDR
jgi:hypothetical protein